MTNSGDGVCRVCGGALDPVAEIADIRDWEYGVEGAWSYRRCGRCGTAQIAPFPTLDDLKRAYEIDYHGHAAAAAHGALGNLLHAINRRLLLGRMRALLPPGAHVLDVGCGNGAFLSQLRALEPASLTGIDFNPKAIARVREAGIQAFEGTFLDFPPRPGGYDAVFMNNYLEHTCEPARELAKAHAVLKPGGRLIGQVPNFDSADRRLFGRFWGGNHAPRHTFQFDPRSLLAALGTAGFAATAVSQSINPAHVAISVQNLMQRNRPDLRRNPALKHGRAPYFFVLLLLALPLNAVFAAAGRSGLIDFAAVRPDPPPDRPRAVLRAARRPL